jgi:hypothetical protein
MIAPARWQSVASLPPTPSLRALLGIPLGLSSLTSLAIPDMDYS